MKPDATRHDPRPEYLRALIADSGMTIHAVARRVGIGERMMRYYVSLDPASYRPAPYAVQYALEQLAR